MRLATPKRKGESNGGGWGCLVAIVVVGAIIYFIANKDKPGGGNSYSQSGHRV